VRMLLWEGPPGPKPEVVVVLLISSVKYRKMEIGRVLMGNHVYSCSLR
jgi:hypothetical protein